MIVIYGTLLAIVDIYAIAYCMRHIPKLLGYPKSAWARHIRRIIKPRAISNGIIPKNRMSPTKTIILLRELLKIFWTSA
jgi:hypothetical protein